jgi:hypothetical protein
MKHIRNFSKNENMDPMIQKKTNVNPETERKEIVQKVIDALVKDQNNHPGYQSFREELEDFLSTFPKE